MLLHDYENRIGNVSLNETDEDSFPVSPCGARMDEHPQPYDGCLMLECGGVQH